MRVYLNWFCDGKSISLPITNSQFVPQIGSRIISNKFEYKVECVVWYLDESVENYTSYRIYLSMIVS